MELQVALTVLRSCEVLEGLSDAHRGLLLVRAKERALDAGTPLFLEGDPSDGWFYLIGKGSVLVSDKAANVPDVTYGPGEMVGEIALVNPSRKRLRTVTAKEATQLLAWSEDDLAKSTPEVFAHLKAGIERTGFDRIARGF